MKRLLKYLLVSFAIVFFYTCKKDENKTVANINDYSISSIVIDYSNTKWIGTDNGLYKSVDNSYELQDISDKVLSLYFEKDANTLWIGTDAGLYSGLINDENFSSSATQNSNFIDNTIKSIFVDETSKRWFGTNLGVTLNKGTIWKKEKFLKNGIQENIAIDFERNEINAIAIGSGNYYFATNTFGLYRAYGYDEAVDAFSGATQWEAPYNGQSATDSIFAAIIDSNGNLWFGGTNGVQRHNNSMDPKTDNDYYISELPSKRVRAIAEAPDGKIWVGTENGIAVFNGSSWTNISNMLTANKYVTAIAFDADGSAIIGTKEGLELIK